MYDIIGDIHGHADALEQLLQNLGYEASRGYYSHPERKVIFVGDYIDRGPKIRETLQIVKDMVEQQQAIVLMGNHEFNAILYNTIGADGDYLRQHSEKNFKQHEDTIKQFEGHQEEYNSYIEWFKTLPIYFENDKIRVVHACWDEDHIKYLRNTLPNDRLTDQLLQQQYKRGSELYDALEVTLKGKELQMPQGLHFLDKDNHKRTELRIKWWINPENLSYKEYSVEKLDALPDETIHPDTIINNKPYLETEKPVFFGHYWISGDAALSVYGENVCCVDYSVAKEGKLVAYRWNGEKCLHHSNMYHVSPKVHS